MLKQLLKHFTQKNVKIKQYYLELNQIDFADAEKILIKLGVVQEYNTKAEF